MTKYSVNHILALLFLPAALLLAGCATTADKRVDFLYETVGVATGGYGDIYLGQDARPREGNEWLLGTITDKDGKKLGNITTITAPSDMIRDAFTQELEAAGYRVDPVETLQPDMAKGVRISSVTIRLDEVSSLLKRDATCSIHLVLEPWRNGSALNKRRYDVDYSLSALSDSDRLLPEIVQKALHGLMKRSVPELVTIIEQK